MKTSVVDKIKQKDLTWFDDLAAKSKARVRTTPLFVKVAITIALRARLCFNAIFPINGNFSSTRCHQRRPALV